MTDEARKLPEAVVKEIEALDRGIGPDDVERLCALTRRETLEEAAREAIKCADSHKDAAQIAWHELREHSAQIETAMETAARLVYSAIRALAK